MNIQPTETDNNEPIPLFQDSGFCEYPCPRCQSGDTIQCGEEEGYPGGATVLFLCDHCKYKFVEFIENGDGIEA